MHGGTLQAERAEHDDEDVEGEDVGDAEGEAQNHRQHPEPSEKGPVSYGPWARAASPPSSQYHPRIFMRSSPQLPALVRTWSPSRGGRGEILDMLANLTIARRCLWRGALASP